jgi:hypothetical protein
MAGRVSVVVISKLIGAGGYNILRGVNVMVVEMEEFEKGMSVVVCLNDLAGSGFMYYFLTHCRVRGGTESTAIPQCAYVSAKRGWIAGFGLAGGVSVWGSESASTDTSLNKRHSFEPWFGDPMPARGWHVQ